MHLGVKNFRRLADIKAIDLRPVTLLLGKNSSGKSSFLRLLPLLRQSLQTKTNSPILWYGDLVDFGSFRDSLHANSEQKEITFIFQDSFPINISTRNISSGPPSRLENREVSIRTEITVGPQSSKETNSVVVKRILIKDLLKKIDFTFAISEDGSVHNCTVDGDDVTSLIRGKITFNKVSILPEPILVHPDEDDVGHRWFRSARFFHYNVSTDIFEALSSNFFYENWKNIVDKKDKSQPDYDDVIGYLVYNNFFEPKFLSSLRDRKFFPKITADALLKMRKSLNSEQEKTLMYASRISAILNSYHNFIARISQTISESLYIGPVRAKSERYYRFQELAISEIDADAKNFPMFLNSLDTSQIEDFSNWIYQLYQIKVELKKEGGHLSLFIVADGISVNIADTGYGFSQVLPVLGQIWWAISGNYERKNARFMRINTPVTLLIEQPELHLHPAHQSNFADAIIRAIANQRKGQKNRNRKQSIRDIRFVIETHSEQFINQIGKLIRENEILSDDVHIIIFEESDLNKGASTSRISYYNDDGILQNWPFGFFRS